MKYDSYKRKLLDSADFVKKTDYSTTIISLLNNLTTLKFGYKNQHGNSFKNSKRVILRKIKRIRFY